MFDRGTEADPVQLKHHITIAFVHTFESVGGARIIRRGRVLKFVPLLLNTLVGK